MRLAVYVHEQVKHFKPHRVSCRYYIDRNDESPHGYWRLANTRAYKKFASNLIAEGLEELEPCKHCKPDM